MSIKESPNFVDEVGKERFQKNRDRLMKLVEEDYKLIAWICWGFGLLFKDLSYKEMFDYIGKVTIKELQEYIVPVQTEIIAENAAGIILDKHFELREAGKVVGYLVLENQLNLYSYAEIEARQTVYFGSELFWEAEELVDKKHYRLITPPTFLWIFPEGPKKFQNFTDIFPIVLPEKRYQRNLNKGGSLEPTVLKPRFTLKSDICQFYLGNPENISKKFLIDTSKAGKETYVLLLLDLLFGFEVSKETRLKMLAEIFNLKGKIVEEEVEIVDGFEIWSMQRFDSGKKEGLDEGIVIGEKKGLAKGKKEGFVEGKENERNQILHNVAKKLINQSKSEGKILSETEALKQAEEFIS